MTTLEPERFLVSTNWTGKDHTFRVEVWPTRVSLLDHLEQVAPEGDWRETNESGETAAGAFLNASGFMSNEAPVHLGTIYYNAEHLDIATVSHEAVHAALFAYNCDILGNHSRARAHLNGTNEQIAYLISELIAIIGSQLYDIGLYNDFDQQTGAAA